MKKIILGTALCLALGTAVLAIPVSAQTGTTTATTTEAYYLDQIHVTIVSITGQIQRLVTQISDLIKFRQEHGLPPGLPNTGGTGSTGLTVGRTLAFGSIGDDVKALQAVLAADAEVYPEGLITGYFGNLTRNALYRFQAKNSLAVTGIVDEPTRVKINSFLSFNKIMFQTRSGMTTLCFAGTTMNTTPSGWLRLMNGTRIVPSCL